MNRRISPNGAVSPGPTAIASIIVAVISVSCIAIMPFVERQFSQRQMQNSSLPLMIVLAIPFGESILAGYLAPKSNSVAATWVVLGAIGMAIGDLFVVFTDKSGSHTLWPIEVVALSALVSGALLAGTAIGRWIAMKPRG